MRIKINLFLLFFLVLNTSFSQNFETKINQIISVLEKKHVKPIGVNDELSERIYNEFIEAVDQSSIIFLAQDITEFSVFKTEIDNQIKNGKTDFFNLVLEKYSIRLSQVDSITKVIVNNDIDFYSDLKLTFGQDTALTYANSLADLKVRWQKMTNLEMLEMMYSSYPKLNFSDKDSVQLAIDFAVEKEKAETECWLDDYGLGDAEYTKEMLMYEFLNSIALAYDPHSSYFTEDIKESFDIGLSKDSKDFGVNFLKEDGVFKVNSMNPGSSAWKSNVVNVGDVIYKIVLENSGELDLNCLDEYDLDDILISSESDKMTLSLIKKSGEKLDVELTKEVLETEDNIMTGILLEGHKKIGYISIPSFYTNWETEYAVGCANDVAKEILKMKNENIEGLILDLRFNGGGSIQEALDLAGIFIDVGPLGIMVRQKGKPYLLKDSNRGRAYSGPLVVMINGASASASEMFAGAMQTYNRGLVVGSSSYGKSTGQLVLPIDTTLWSYKSTKEPTDYVKITTSKVYNIDNGTHQAKGIFPDVVIPDLWDSFIPTEAEERYFIANDSIKKKMYFTPYPLLPIEALKAQSQERINGSVGFQKIITSNDSIESTSFETYDIPLNFEGFWAFMNLENEQYDMWKKSVNNFETNNQIRNLAYYADLEKLDKNFNNRSQKIFDRKKKDIMLDEAYNIMIDLISKI